MLFFYPMWDNEAQRIGKQKCTPVGYAFHATAEVLGFLGFLCLLGEGAYLGFEAITGAFRASYLWLFGIPFGMGLVAEVLYQLSWVLAAKRGFEYDWDNREASWIENGTRMTYKYKPHERDALGH